MRFVDTAPASDELIYRVGTTRRRVNMAPGRAVTWRLAPGKFTSHVPPDRATHSPAQALRTTTPITIDVDQPTEPHIYRVRIRLAVAAAIGDTDHCALISSRVDATTYYPGGPPPN